MLFKMGDGEECGEGGGVRKRETGRKVRKEEIENGGLTRGEKIIKQTREIYINRISKQRMDEEEERLVYEWISED